MLLFNFTNLRFDAVCLVQFDHRIVHDHQKLDRSRFLAFVLCPFAYALNCVPTKSEWDHISKETQYNIAFHSNGNHLLVLLRRSWNSFHTGLSSPNSRQSNVFAGILKVCSSSNFSRWPGQLQDNGPAGTSIVEGKPFVDRLKSERNSLLVGMQQSNFYKHRENIFKLYLHQDPSSPRRST